MSRTTKRSGRVGNVAATCAHHHSNRSNPPRNDHPMKMKHTLLTALSCLYFLTAAHAAPVSNLLNYQGRVAVEGVNFNSPPNRNF